MARDYSDKIDDARDELERLQADAQRAVESEDSPTEIRREIGRIAGELSKLRLRIPVSDFDANPIPEGRELDYDAGQFGIWLDEQWERFRLHSDRRALSAKKTPGAHSVYR